MAVPSDDDEKIHCSWSARSRYGGETWRSLIRGRFSMRLWEVLLWRLLSKPQPSPQRPLAEGGMRLEYPRIGVQAERLGAQIVSVDEAAVHSVQPSGIPRAPMGGTPVLDTTAARFRLDMLSAFSPRRLRFMPSEQRLSAVRRFVVSTQGPLAAVSAAPRTPAQPPRAGLEPPDPQARKLAVDGPEPLERRIIRFLRALWKPAALARALSSQPSMPCAAARHDRMFCFALITPCITPWGESHLAHY